MSLYRFDEMVPENFIFGQDVGITLASLYQEGLENGILHFHPISVEKLETVREILDCIHTHKCVAVWHFKEMGPNQCGITTYNDKGEAKGELFTSCHPQILKAVYGTEDLGEILDGENMPEGRK